MVLLTPDNAPGRPKDLCLTDPHMQAENPSNISTSTSQPLFTKFVTTVCSTMHEGEIFVVCQ